MAMAITLDGKTAKLHGKKRGKPKTAGGLVSSLGLSREEVLVKVDGKVRPEGFSIAGAKKVEVIRVVFGG